MDVPVLSLEKLLEHEPCFTEYTKVSTAFPDGIPLTKESMDTLRGLSVSLSWAADYLLSDEANTKLVAECSSAVSAYRAASMAAWDEYDTAVFGVDEQWAEDRNRRLEACVRAGELRNAALDAAHLTFSTAIAGPLLEAFLDDYRERRGVFSNM